MTDPRKIKLKKGLQQLSRKQLTTLLETPEDHLILDEYYYRDGRY